MLPLETDHDHQERIQEPQQSHTNSRDLDDEKDPVLGVDPDMRRNRRPSSLLPNHHHHDNSTDTTAATSIRSKSSHKKKPLSPTAVVARYLISSCSAIILACSCLHRENDGNRSLLNAERVAEVCFIYILILSAFACLFQSDPGYLTVGIMNEINDAATLDGTRVQANDDQDLQEQALDHDLKGPNGPAPRHRHNGRHEDTTEYSSTIDESEQEQLMDPLTAGPQRLAPTRRPFCEDCRFDPLLRSHHCKVCDKHVAMFDHHCDFVGTCIGERNHCRFWWFLTFQAAGFWWLTNAIGSSSNGFLTFLFHSSAKVTTEEESWLSSNQATALLVIVAELYVYPLALAAWLIWGIHTFLALTNSTTFEWTKGSRYLEYLKGTRMSDLPYSSNCPDQNLRLFCCQRDAFCDCGKPTWKPTIWQPPGKVVRDSENWWEHPWQNKYWSCC